MLSALGGISTIWLVIAVGWLIAHLRLVDAGGRRLMSLLAFSVGSPALMFGLLSRASLAHVFSRTVVVNALAALAAGLAYLVVARSLLRPTAEESVIGYLASSYTNASNFGLPIAIALLGDATWTAPVLLMQVGLVLPLCIALLDVLAARRSGVRLTWSRYASLPFRNPITVGILAGLAANLLHVRVPRPVMASVDMIGQTSVPLMLLAFGISLRLDPLPGRGPHLAHAALTIGLKTVGHPLAAWLIGTALGLTGAELYGVVVLAALPAAQNVYITATRYDRGELLARDAVFWTTIASVPVLLVVAELLGPAR